MNTVSGTKRAPRRQSQDGSGDKLVVIVEASSRGVGSRRGPHAPIPGALNSPIDVEAIEDEVQAVSPSRVPLPRRNRRTRREPITVVDLEVEASREGSKRQRVEPVGRHLYPDWGARSSLQSNAVQTSKEPAKEVPEEPSFTCPICWNKMEEPSTTTCGHVFCDTCIKQAIKVQKKCPTCRKGLKMNSVHRIYLPNGSS